MTLVVRPKSSFFRVKVVAAGVALVVHGSVVALLMTGLSPEPGSGPVIKTMTTELIAMAPPVETTEPLSLDPQSVPDVASPETEPQPVPEPEPLPESPPQPEPKPKPKPKPKPAPPSENSAAEIAAADLARKRVADEKRQEELARQKREQQQQERQREKAAQQQQAQDAELARQRHAANLAAAAASAEENRQRLADSQQYVPISKKAPDYPRRALGQRLEGDCTVGYTVTPQGHVQAPKVVGECHPLFVRPSIEAAKAFKYQPRLINGMAVAVPNVRNTFHYKIEDR